MKIIEVIFEESVRERWVTESELEQYIPAERQGLWVNKLLRPIVLTMNRHQLPSLDLDELVPSVNKFFELGHVPVHVLDGKAFREDNVVEIKWKVNVQSHGFNENRVNKDMRATEFVSEKKASAKLCNSNKKLSRSMYSSCVAQGLRAHHTDHTAGTGKQGKKGSGVHLDNTKRKSVRYNGDVKDYSGKRKKK